MQAIVTSEMRYRGATVKVGTVLSLSDLEFNDFKQYNKVAIYTAPAEPVAEPVAETLHVEQPAAQPTELSDKIAPKINTRTPRSR